MKMKIRNIFLSSEGDSSLPLVSFCEENGISILRKSCISFKRVAFDLPSEWDVVFFSSPRSFDFFLSKGIDWKPGQELACIGNETRKHIESAGFQVSFTGENAGNPEEIAALFKEWLGTRIALFPQSTQSNKSIEKVLSPQQRIPLYSYQTIEIPVHLKEEFSVYVFTSPSNYDSFNMENIIPEESVVISWGEMTRQRIVNQGGKSDYVLKTATYSELLEILQEINV
ncbi:uroporphyrinogen-III synthase [Fluviicola sp.]|uniref:uroporphyrinogen-III synthase n=1 Tax=Fluviicola sp. TaxID=1917219 RepID=UPI002830A5E9|nr:uroporphyrinogen-III synthase [Fluviicola sp.]MDR0801494.1 uroporphyrinogen-III synthase [Fluviicola sp.]